MDIQQTIIHYLNKWVLFGLTGILPKTSLVYEDTLFCCVLSSQIKFLKSSPFHSQEHLLRVFLH